MHLFRLNSLFVAISLLFVSSTSTAEELIPSHSAHQRFTVLLDQFDRILSGATPAEAVKRLDGNDNRSIVFLIEGLARMYDDEHATFEDMKIRFKGVEDAIGDYQKWSRLVRETKPGSVSDDVLARLVQNRDDSLAAFEALLLASGFVTADGSALPYSVELRKFLATYSFGTEVEDRDRMLKKLRKELKKIRKTEYDFSHLEEGDGVHEFRRDIRWFSIQTKSLNGLVVLKPKDSVCPVSAYAPIVHDSIANTKYAVLPVNPQVSEAVAVSPCLYVTIAKLIRDLDSIKDKAEAADSTSEGEPTDSVDPAVQAELNGILEDLRTQGLFDLLRDELTAGMSPAALTEE